MEQAPIVLMEKVHSWMPFSVRTPCLHMNNSVNRRKKQQKVLVISQLEVFCYRKSTVVTV